MRSRWSGLFWGLALIIAGVFFVALNADLIPELSEYTWSIVLGLAAVIFFAGYLLSGWRNWAQLFPAVGCGVAALALYLTDQDVQSELIGTIVMVTISLPFWVAFLANRAQNLWALIPAWILTMVGVIILLADTASEDLFVSLILIAVGLPFLVVFLRDRKQWWALIPAYILGVIAAIFLVVGTRADELIGALVMFAIALPFLVVYLRDHKQAWALIPAGILGVVGVIVLLATQMTGVLAGTVILLAIAIPFYVVYFMKRENWWALIPAGVLTSVALGTLTVNLNLESDAQARLTGGIIFAGIALTFGAIWSLRKVYDTDWAKYPAVILAAVAILIALLGVRMELVWAAGLIVVGVWLLFRGVRARPKQP